MSKSKCMDYGMFFLRFVVGMGFFLHGLQKFSNVEGMSGFFASIGLPIFVFWLVAIVEIVSGVLMIFGLWMKYAGYAMALVMLGAIITLHAKQGFLGGMELPLVYLASALTLAWSGHSKWSLGKNCNGEGCCSSERKTCDNCEGCKNVCSMHEN